MSDDRTVIMVLEKIDEKLQKEYGFKLYHSARKNRTYFTDKEGVFLRLQFRPKDPTDLVVCFVVDKEKFKFAGLDGKWAFDEVCSYQDFESISDGVFLNNCVDKIVVKFGGKLNKSDNAPITNVAPKKHKSEEANAVPPVKTPPTETPHPNVLLKGKNITLGGLEWIVLNVLGNGVMLVMSQKVVGNTHSDNIYNWLDNFYKSKFSAAEKNMIMPTDEFYEVKFKTKRMMGLPGVNTAKHYISPRQIYRREDDNYVYTCFEFGGCNCVDTNGKLVPWFVSTVSADLMIISDGWIYQVPGYPDRAPYSYDPVHEVRKDTEYGIRPVMWVNYNEAAKTKDSPSLAKQTSHQANSNAATSNVSTSAAPPPAPIEKPQYNVGQRIKFGGYEWIVLFVREKHIFVISEIAVALMSMGDVDWQYSNVRRWLNNDFYNSFNQADQQRIAMQKVTYAPENEGTKTVNGYFGLLTIEDFIGFLHIHSNVKKVDEISEYESDGELYRHSTPCIKGINVAVVGNPNQRTHWWILSQESIIKGRFAIAGDAYGNHLGYPELDFKKHGGNTQSLCETRRITDVSGVRPVMYLKI